MNKIQVVIGANYGDEGKGHLTDYLAGADALVVRFNGGAQAGHTVTTPNKFRHVFHHFGSGLLRGSPTFLSKHFIVNPLLFREEHKKLNGLVINVTVDPLALVTTPYDMMINAAIEAKRGGNKHGSCGVGINETVTRSATMPIRYEDLTRYTVQELLEWVRKEWVPGRLGQLGLELDDLPYLNHVGITNTWQDDVFFMLKHAPSQMWAHAYSSRSRVIFEGAQGLRLDEYGGDFPYVTRSRTGLTNVMSMLSENGAREDMDVYYVTRPYLTRHGAGPLDNEWPSVPQYGIQDRTNVDNMHQGSLRFAWLDVNDTADAIKQDLASTPTMVIPQLAMTCIDQAPEIMVKIGGVLQKLPAKEIARELSRRAGLFGGVLFNGETRDDVVNQ